MKQTTNALTMLLKAYRAVFTAAFTKGLASAVVLTAGLAAGAAQATTIDTATTISGGSTTTYDSLEINAALTVDKTPVYVKDSVTVNNALNITGPGASLVGAADQSGATSSQHTAVFTGKDGAVVNVSGGYIEMNRVVIDGGTYNVGGLNGENDYWDYTSFIGGGMGTVNGNGFEIHGGTINLNEDSHLMIASGEKMLIDGGTINVNGDSSVSSFIRGVTGSTINMTAGVIDVKKQGGIFAPAFNLDGGTITLDANSTLLIDGVITKAKSSALTDDEASFDDGTFNLNSGKVTVGSGATLKIGATTNAQPSGDLAVNITAGVLDNQGTVAVNHGTVTVNNEADAPSVLTGAYTIGASGSVVLDGAYDLGTASVTNSGSITLQNGYLLVDTLAQAGALGSIALSEIGDVDTEGSIIVQGDVTIDAAAAAYFGNNGIHGTGGTLDGANVTVSVASLNTYGVELYTAGDMKLTQSGGTTLSGSGSTLSAEGSFSVVDKLTIAGDKSTNLSLDNGNYGSNTHNFIGNVEVTAGSFEVDGGTWDASSSTVTLNAGTSGSEFALLGVGTYYGYDVNTPSDITFKDIKVTKGQVIVENGKLTTDSLTTTQTDGVVEIGGGQSEAVMLVNGGSGSTVVIGSGSVTIKNAGTFELGSAVADGITVSGSTVTVSGATLDEGFVLSGGTLKVDFAADESFDADELKALKDKLIQGYDSSSDSVNGFLNVGSAQLADIKVSEDGQVSWDDIASGGGAGIVGDTTNNDLSSANVTGITSEDKVYGQYGSLTTADAATTTVNVQNQVVLNGSAGSNNYAQNASGAVAGISGSEANTKVTLQGNGGNVGAINLTGNDSAFIVNAANNVTVQGNISVTSGDISLQTATTVSGDITASEGNVSLTASSVTGAITATKGDLALSNTTVGGNVTAASGDMTLTNAVVNGTISAASGTLTVQAELQTSGAAQITAQALTAESAVINNEEAEITIGNTSSSSQTSSITGSAINASKLTISSDGSHTHELTIDGGSVVTLNELVGASGATINVGTEGEDSSSGELYVDLLNLNGADLVVDPEWTEKTAIVAAQDIGSAASDDDLVTVDGNATIGRNAALVIGLSEDDAKAVVAEYQVNGSLTPDGVGALLYTNKQIEVGADKGILLTTETISTQTPAANTVTLGAGTALIVTDDAGLDATGAAKPVFIFTDTDNGGNSGSVVGEGGQVILDGEWYAGDEFMLAKTSGGQTVDVTGVGIDVSSTNGLLNGTIAAGSGTVVLTVNDDESREILNGASDPMYTALMQTYDRAYMQTRDGLGKDYLVAAARNGNGSEADTAARMAVFGGALQATMLAQSTSTDAIAGRMGLAAPATNMVFANNQNGGGLWFMPVYRSQDSDSFDADGIDYGADIDLYGAALGADFTTESGVRVGAMFNIGSGDADGEDAASAVSNDFDYFGIAMYAGMTFGNFALTADAGFTQVSNDLDADSGKTGFGKLTADTDTTAVTVGVTGQYKFETPYIDVVPHLGVRYTALSMDSYDVKSAQGVVASTDAETHDIVSIPLGVSFSKDFAFNEWSVRPVFDVTVTANCGDTEFDTDTNFAGFGIVSTSAEIADDVTYGVGLGVQAQYSDSVSFGINANYVGSENVDEFGVTADVRYMF